MTNPPADSSTSSEHSAPAIRTAAGGTRRGFLPRFPNSIRWSLQVWHAGLLALVLIGFGAVTYYVIAKARYQEIDAQLERSVQMLAAGLRPPPPPRLPPRMPSDMSDRPAKNGQWPSTAPQEKLPPGRKKGLMPWPRGPEGPPPDFGPPDFGPVDVPNELAQRFGDGQSGSLYFVVWQNRFGVVRSSRSADDIPDPGPPPRGDAPTMPPPSDFAHEPGPAPVVDMPEELAPPGPPGPPGMDLFPPHILQPPQFRTRSLLREVYLYGPFGTCLLVGKSTEGDQAELRKLAWMMSATGVAVLAVGLAGGWFISLRAIRPIHDIAAVAKEISATSLSRRIDLAGTQSELGTLAAVLNDTFARLEAAFQQQVRFTADASHELRTPLAVIHTHAQLALSRPRTAEEYRKTIETCLRGSSRMKSLVDSLLFLAKVDAGRMSLERSRFDLRDVVEECLALVGPLAEEQGISIEMRLPSVEVTADPSRIAQLLTNLLTNAIRYNRPGGRIRVALDREPDDVVLSIADTGVGIPPEHQPHVFERFYRVDAARSREEGGSGLGLAICRSIVEAHGGTLSFQSEVGVGTTFTIRLPRHTPNNLSQT
jgi:heavy metal sensor kinase